MPRLSTIRWPVALAAGLLLIAASPRAGHGDLLPGNQAARPDQEVSGTAVLAGQAVDAATGAPVANTLFGLSRRRTAGANAPSDTSTALALVMADAQGRFVVRDIPAGSYLLLATAPGYIVSNYGQARAAGPSRTIDLGEGERLTNLVVPLWRHARISGTVLDERGEPVVGVTVRVLRRMADGPGGEHRYLQGTLATTDDRGRYRLTRLTPGQFLVSVPQTQVTVPASVVDTFVQAVAGRGGGSAGGELLDQMASSSAVPLGGGGVRIDDLLLQSSYDGGPLAIPPPVDGRLFVYPTTYFAQGSADGPEAIVVAAGEERTGVDIHLAPEPTIRVSGTVTAGGSPSPNVVVRLMGADGPRVQIENGFEAGATVTGSDGSFTLLGVPAGRYLLKALRLPRPRLPPALAANPAIVAAYDADPPAGERPSLIGAQVALDVGDADVRDLAVALAPGATVSGRIVFAGGAPPSPELRRKIGVLLSSEDGGLPGAALQIAALQEDDTFGRAAPAPGKYMLAGLAVPPRWRVSEISVDGQPLTAPLDLTGDDVAGVVITYTDRVGTIAGTAQNANGAGEVNAEVVVFPTDRSLWTSEPLNWRRPQIQQVPADGAFSVEGLLPGEYYVAIVEAEAVPDIAEPEFFAAVRTFATRVTVTEGQATSLRLTVGRIR
jgi:hypothetical protein